ncbi:hypothetical protein SKAU_G00382380 [Synaphobranchus kaupii]|uniref:Uncharacterized protein n=1 Tax=Synaphobranchus kaupii TaxID=118154 RepID=A0A9Q1ICR7_SYNKA|nr:hypothetical protein SKAU_G00382380 [Synaphobranchus kaupii]
MPSPTSRDIFRKPSRTARLLRLWTNYGRIRIKSHEASALGGPVPRLVRHAVGWFALGSAPVLPQAP